MRKLTITLLVLGGFGPLFLPASVDPESAPRRLPGLFRYESEHARMIEQEARAAGIQPALMMAVVAQESRFDWWRVSPSGAVGLAQLMPGTAWYECHLADRYNPRLNVRCGSYYLAKMIRLCRGNIVCGLASYNEGYSRTIANGGRPKTKEARDYVPRVLSYWRVYSH